jgi:hypothetical protein
MQRYFHLFIESKILNSTTQAKCPKKTSKSIQKFYLTCATHTRNKEMYFASLITKLLPTRLRNTPWRWGKEVKLHAFLAFTLNGGLSDSHLGCSTPRESPGTYWMEGWVGPTVTLDVAADKNPYPYWELNMAIQTTATITLVTEISWLIIYHNDVR